MTGSDASSSAAGYSNRQDLAAGRRGRPWGSLALLVALALVVGLGSALGRYFYGERPAVVHELSGETMGTTWTARLVLPERTSLVRLRAIDDTIRARLDLVNALMSSWDTTSEVSRLNLHSGTDPIPVSLETFEVLLAAREVGEASGGAFDVTVGPAVAAWGFGPGAEVPPPLPSERLLDSLAAFVGRRLLELDPAATTVSKKDPRVVIDLSAIAKGYGVDQVAEGLIGHGLTAFAVEVGGEVRAQGRKPDGTAWRAGVEAPVPGARRVHRTLELVDEAVATSGDYRNFYEVDGVRYAHILDPRTLRPVPRRGFSVSVVHARAMYADAWATALSVLGPVEGIAVADREGLAAVFVVEAQAGTEDRASRAMTDRDRR